MTTFRSKPAREIAAVDAMLEVARAEAGRGDARTDWLIRWIKTDCLDGNAWNDRRLIVFTEYEDTRRWLEKRLRERLAGTDRLIERIGVFSGAICSDRREAL